MRVAHIVNSTGLGGTEAWLHRVLPRSDYDHVIVPLHVAKGLDFATSMRANGLDVLDVSPRPRRLEADVVHVHLHYTALPWIVVSRLLGSSVLWHAHTDTRVVDQAQPAWKRLRRLVTSRLGVWSSHVQLACSKDAAAAQFGPGVAASVLPLAVSEPQESTPNRKPPAELRIGFFGRFEGRKRPELVVETVRCLVDMGVDACAELFGDGPMVGEVMAAIERNGLRDRVVIRPGTLDPVGEMTRFRVVLVPSIFEGFGLVPVEAASAGVPLVATTEVQSARLLDGPVRILEVSDSADEWAAAVREVGSAQTTYGAKTRALLAGLAPEVSAAGLDATYRALLTATDQQR